LVGSGVRASECRGSEPGVGDQAKIGIERVRYSGRFQRDWEGARTNARTYRQDWD
jgi:hypothetical protein